MSIHQLHQKVTYISSLNLCMTEPVHLPGAFPSNIWVLQPCCSTFVVIFWCRKCQPYFGLALSQWLRRTQRSHVCSYVVVVMMKIRCWCAITARPVLTSPASACKSCRLVPGFASAAGGERIQNNALLVGIALYTNNTNIQQSLYTIVIYGVLLFNNALYIIVISLVDFTYRPFLLLHTNFIATLYHYFV